MHKDRETGPAPLTRRSIMLVGAAAVASLAMPSVVRATPRGRVAPGRLWVIRLDNGEQLDAPYAMHSADADRNAWIVWSHFWRDVKDRDQAVWMDRTLLLSLNLLQMALSAEKGEEVAIMLSSGFRTVERNAKIEGAAINSWHTKGQAGDFIAKGFTATQIADYAESLGHTGGMGRYEGFTHIDTGPPRRWGHN